MVSPTKYGRIRADVATPARSHRDLLQLPINHARPLVMHIDLNSCFATIEQQANPLYRHKPLAVGAYTRGSGIVLAASYEAKALGIKLGTSVREAKAICPGIIILMPDPPKYREAHCRFREILLEYSDEVVAKSIDEFVLDFHGSLAVQAGHSLEAVGRDIKRQIRQRMGEYVSVNVGIGSNRFLAKLAAGLHKPDGLDIIDHRNLEATYRSVSLLDLPGINRRFKARLQAAGIATPYEMYQASGNYLKNFVFFSKLGHQWHQRLRGWEVDNVEWGRKSVGHQYALEHKTTDRDEIKRLLMKLCEKTGRRLRRYGCAAHGIELGLRYAQSADGKRLSGFSGPYRYDYWHQSQKLAQPLYTTTDIYRAAVRLLDSTRFVDKVSLITVSVFELQACQPEQLGLFDDERRRYWGLARAADHANDRYGEFTVVPAIMANMSKTILDRVAFGNVGDLDNQVR